MMERSHFYAALRGVRLDAVIFTNKLPAANYMAWSVCSQYVIGVNARELERPDVYQYIPAFAAHEVCHIYYKDNLPCEQRRTVDIEKRADECSNDLVGGRL